MLTIYDVEGFPNPARVRMALADKKALDKVTFVPVDVMGGEHRAAPFRTMNPDATVPCAQLTDGTVIGRCTPITEYIDAAFDGPSLIGETPVQRATTHMMTLRVEEWLLDALSAYFHHATDGLGPDLEIDQVPAWGERQKGRAIASMQYFDSVLAEQPYLAGDAYSMADIALLAALALADFAGVPIAEDLVHLHAWRAKSQARYQGN
jgi:glutathione S-transferase